MSTAEKIQAETILRTRIGVMTYLAPREAMNQDPVLNALDGTITDCLAQRENQIVVDLSAVKALNSRALEIMLDGQDRLVRVGGYLKVTHVPPLLREVFQLTGFSQQVGEMDPGVTSSAHRVAEPKASGSRKLGDILLDRGLVTEGQVAEAVQRQSEQGKRLGQIIIERGWVSEGDMLSALGEQLSIPCVRMRSGLYDPEVVRQLEKGVAQRLRVLPLFRVHNVLSLATQDPQAIPTFEEIEERLQCRIRPVLARQEDILKTLGEAYGGSDLLEDIIAEVDDDFTVVESDLPDDYTAIDEMAADSPVINLVNSIIQRAVHDHASDIHIEPTRNKARVRYRIDGLLYEVMTPRPELHPAMVSRLKVMANLDIAERRLPQDGRIQVYTQGRSVDLRFSSLPGLYGEKIVLRVLDKNQAILDIKRLGMAASTQETFRTLLGRSHGLILVTGPTGSGKTTSLYAALNHLNTIEKNIVTIEDPIEYQIEIVNQNEVKNPIGLSFAKMLKHVLRQDPDIVMVGEIRERETAEIAVQAALTGHLVLSTLHTNDSVGAVTRMIDMGVEPYLLSSALIGVVAQRLVRTVCPACKTSFLAPADVMERYGWSDRQHVRLARGRGCAECYDSGYRGRVGIQEILEVDLALQQLIMSNPSRDRLTDYVARHGLRTLRDEGLKRARDGVTTIEEVTRVINS